ncbi:MAG: hypothetical protein ACRDXX_12025, partial [Stackebrandtia sp.]
MSEHDQDGRNRGGRGGGDSHDDHRNDRGIGAARRYSPRGRSVRDFDREDERRRRGGVTRRTERDAFRPALRLVEGGAAST